MYFASLCELRMEEASRQRSEKLDDTQRKLDLFYSNMDLVRKHQSPVGVVEGVESEKGHGSIVGRKDKVKVESELEGKGNSVDATPILDPSLKSDRMELEPGTKDESKDELNLELELDQALSRMEPIPNGTKASNHSNTSTNEIKRTRSSFRLVLKQLPPNEQTKDGVPIKPPPRDQKRCGGGDSNEKCVSEKCPNSLLLQFQYSRSHVPNEASQRQGNGGGRQEEDDVSMSGDQDGEEVDNEETGNEQTGNDVTARGHGADDEMAMFEHIEVDLSPLESKDPKQRPHKEYPLDYHSLEFLPYNPLPDQLEATIFPKCRTPLPLYNDPYWPRKRECLELVNELKMNPKLASFTGSFITPEARGVRCVYGLCTP